MLVSIAQHSARIPKGIKVLSQAQCRVDDRFRTIVKLRTTHVLLVNDVVQPTLHSLRFGMTAHEPSRYIHIIYTSHSVSYIEKYSKNGLECRLGGNS